MLLYLNIYITQIPDNLTSMYSMPAQIPLPSMPPMLPKPVLKVTSKSGGILKKSSGQVKLNVIYILYI